MFSDSQHSLTLGPIALKVKNSKLVKEFYVKLVGLEVLSERRAVTVLGYDKEPILELHRNTKLQPAIGIEAGMYHLALVFSTRSLLAATIKHLAQELPTSYQGSADHLVSEAFYFTDPEGNGVELYYDRVRSQWQYQDGKPLMGSEYLPIENYVKEHAGKSTGGSTMCLGHVHLQVGDIPTAREFYIDLLGFDLMWELPTALFVSRDGYHHHLGMNTWHSDGAEQRPEDITGLHHFTLIYHQESVFTDILQKLSQSQVKIKKISDKSYQCVDPWGLEIHLQLA
jgi:catechol 2,3-dioxygenase